MPLDTRIAMGGINPLDTQAKLMTLSDLGDQQQMRGLQMQQARDGMQRQQQLRNLLGGLAPNTGDDQRIGALRGAGYFDEADKLQSGMLTRDKTRADIGKIGADTGKTTAETAQITQTISSRDREAAVKNVAALESPDQAREALIQMVNSGQLPPDVGQQIHSTIPQDPGAFRQWQVGMLRRIMDAKDAAATLTPKLQTLDTGGSQQVVDMNPMTRGAAPSAFAKTQTPDSVASNDTQRRGQNLSADTARRGQNMADGRARDGNDIARQAARTQLVETPDGYALVDKGTGLARPAATFNGAQVQGKDPGLNDTQSKALLFGSRMREADKIIRAMSAEGVQTPSLVKQAVEGTPLIGGALGMAANATVASPEQQKVEQAQRDFINAVLRRESGAAIAESEFSNARKQYFAQPGDSGSVRQQKAQNRQLATRALMEEVPAKRRESMSAPTSDAGVPDDIAAILRKHGGK